MCRPTAEARLGSRPGARSRRGSRPAAGLVLLLLASTLLALLLSGCTELTGGGSAATGGTQPGASSDATRPIRQAVAELVKTRSTALSKRNPDAWASTVADPASDFGVEQLALHKRMDMLPISSLTMKGVTVEPRTDATDGAAWVANLTLGYQLDGFDRGQRLYNVSYLLTQTPNGWRFSGIGPGQNELQLFDLSGFNILKSPKTLVVGDTSESSMRAYLALGDAAYTRVAAIWGQALPSVIVAPKSVEELGALLGQDPARLGQVGAITAGPLTDGAVTTTDRVFINPVTVEKLSKVGREVVVTHELVHVTVRGTTTRTPPLWLAEGFADDVALKPTGLPVRTVAAELIKNVKAGKGPTGLPTAEAFDPKVSTIEPAYNAAWLAVSQMRQDFGQEKVVAFYRAVAGTPETVPAGSTDDLAKEAFQSVLGTTQDAFVASWLAYLGTLG